MRNDTEVIIIGGGPAGVTTAKVLVENGIKVTLLDKAKFPRRKACAGGLTIRVLKEFPFVKDFMDTYIYSVNVHSTDLKNHVNVCSEDLKKPLIGMSKNRTDFDKKMLDLLSGMECKVITGEKVINIEINNNNVIVYTQNGKNYTCLAVVGADSAISTVAKLFKIGLYDPKRKLNEKEDLSVSIEKEILFNNSGEDNKDIKDPLTIQLFFHFNNLKGYGWSFPRSIGTNIGVISLIKQGHVLKDSTKKFEQFLIEKNYLPDNSTENDEIGNSKYMGAVLPSSRQYKRIISDRVMLVGDAGGFCSPLTGEGIYFSMKSGQLAGELLGNLVHRYRMKKKRGASQKELSKCFSKTVLKKINSRIKKTIGKDLKLHYRVKKFVFNKKIFDLIIKWAMQDRKLAHEIVNIILGGPKSKFFFIKMAWHYIKYKI